MKRQVLALWCALMLVLATSPAWADQKLVGQWALNGQPYLVLNKDGTGTLGGDVFTWQVQGNALVLSAGGKNNVLPYRLNSSVLTLQFGINPLSLRRVEGKSASHPAKNASDPLAQLLLSSAWCTLKYNQTTGASSTFRFQFFNNGAYSNSGRSETYNSGRNGAVAGQYDNGGRGQWAVRNGQLYVSSPPEQPDMQPMPVTVSRNSSGYPVINTEGVEYSMCK